MGATLLHLVTQQQSAQCKTNPSVEQGDEPMVAQKCDTEMHIRVFLCAQTTPARWITSTMTAIIFSKEKEHHKKRAAFLTQTHFSDFHRVLLNPITHEHITSHSTGGIGG